MQATQPKNNKHRRSSLNGDGHYTRYYFTYNEASNMALKTYVGGAICLYIFALIIVLLK